MKTSVKVKVQLHTFVNPALGGGDTDQLQALAALPSLAPGN